MTENKHTPGPQLGWDLLGGRDEHWELVGKDGELIGDVCFCKAANARLIAAAPELLEALKAYRDACYEQDINLGPITADAEAAIAKAERAHAGGMQGICGHVSK